MSTPAPGNFGSHLARVIGEAVNHAIALVLPAHHAERVRQHEEWAKQTADELRGGIVPMFERLLETEAVHPAIEPIIRKIVEGK